MTNLEQQLKDWKIIKQFIEEIRLIPDELACARKEAREKMWCAIKDYYQTYRIKFDYWNEPK
jgi:hypothetical protein